MSDRSLVAPIALGIALTGWPACDNVQQESLKFPENELPVVHIFRHQFKPHGQDRFGSGVTGVCLYLLLKKDEEWSDERSHVTSRHVVLEVCTYYQVMLNILNLFKVSYLPD